ncbi:DUF533 domain-containing protein [Desulfomarina sp.]
MFNAEKLLGKLVQEVIGSSSGKGSMLGNIASSGGLMTAIGLGVGAFEIFKDQNRKQESPPPPPPPGSSPGTPPPPPGSGPPPPPVPPAETNAGIGNNELAIRMIQVIISAAYADGYVDEDEKKAILDQFGKAELSGKENEFLLEQIHNPKSIDELTENITDPAVCKAMYTLAVRSVPIDTPEERRWFDRFAEALALDEATRKGIETEAE